MAGLSFMTTGYLIIALVAIALYQLTVPYQYEDPRHLVNFFSFKYIALATSLLYYVPGLTSPHVNYPMASRQYLGTELLVRSLAKDVHVETTVAAVRKAFSKLEFPSKADLSTTRFSHSYVDQKQQGPGQQEFDLEWVVAPGASMEKGVIMWIHGGGLYANGGLHVFRHFAGELSRRSGYAVLLPDYRLMPEHSFQAALQDCVEAYLYLLRVKKIPASRIVVGGESAGGTAAGLLLLRLRSMEEEKKKGETFLPKAFLLVSQLDASIAYDDEKRVENGGFHNPFLGGKYNDPIVHAGNIRFNVELWLEHSTPEGSSNNKLTRKEMSPRLASSHLRGLPPLFVQVGRFETLLPDSLAYVEAFKKDGGDVQVSIRAPYLHMDFVLYDVYPEASEALDELVAFCRLHLDTK